jgi:hypothetical protein
VKLKQPLVVVLAAGIPAGAALFLISCDTTTGTVVAPLKIPGAHYVGSRIPSLSGCQFARQAKLENAFCNSGCFGQPFKPVNLRNPMKRCGRIVPGQPQAVRQPQSTSSGFFYKTPCGFSANQR